MRIDAHWIVPVEPAGVLTGHAVIVDGGRIVALLPVADADARYAPRETRTLGSHVLIPGLVNAHTHTAMTLLRGIADDVPLKPWLEQHIWPREGRFVSPEFVFDGTLLGAAEMLRGGITCCNDMYFYPDAAARAYEIAGMRALLGMPVLDFPTPYAADADAYLARGLAARDAFRHAPLLSFALAPHAPYTVSDATWARIVMYARQLDLPIQTHLAETRAEVDDALAATGVTPLARLDRLGATGPDFRRDPCRARHGRRHRHAGAARLPRRALPGVEHEARERHCAGDGAARARRQRGARQRRRRVEQSARSVLRDAPREPAREGDDRRCRRACPRPRRCRWPR